MKLTVNRGKFASPVLNTEMFVHNDYSRKLFCADEQFLVQIQTAPNRGKITPGPARLHIQDHRFCMTVGVPPRLVGFWLIRQLRSELNHFHHSFCSNSHLWRWCCALFYIHFRNIQILKNALYTFQYCYFKSAFCALYSYMSIHVSCSFYKF